MRRRNSDEELRDLERRLRSGDLDAARAYGRRLVRLGRATEDQAQLLDGMGPDAWIAWGKDGGEYEWRPESIEFGDSWAEEDEDRDGNATWRRGWTVDGFAVRRHADGSPMIVRTHWVVDTDGNWDDGGEEEWPVGSPHDELAQARAIRDRADSWVTYFAWIAGSHEDPLGELTIPTRREPDAKRIRWREVVAWEDVPRTRRLRHCRDEFAEAEAEVRRLDALAPTCGRCGTAIEQDEHGAWVDHKGGDACDGGVHSPESEHERTLRVWITERGLGGLVDQDALGFDEGADGENAAEELGEGSCCSFHEFGGDPDAECQPRRG